MYLDIYNRKGNRKREFLGIYIEPNDTKTARDDKQKSIADTIIDRIVHDAHRIELKGESLRKTRKRQKPM